MKSDSPGGRSIMKRACGGDNELIYGAIMCDKANLGPRRCDDQRVLGGDAGARRLEGQHNARPARLPPFHGRHADRFHGRRTR